MTRLFRWLAIAAVLCWIVEAQDIRIETAYGPIILSDVKVHPGNVPRFEADVDNRTDTEWHYLALRFVAHGNCRGHRIELNFRAQFGKFTPFGAGSTSDNLIPLAGYFGDGCSFEKISSVVFEGGERLKYMESTRVDAIRREAEREAEEKDRIARKRAELSRLKVLDSGAESVFLASDRKCAVEFSAAMGRLAVALILQ